MVLWTKANKQRCAASAINPTGSLVDIAGHAQGGAGENETSS